MVWNCPKGHEVASLFNLDDVRRGVAAGDQSCFCAVCGENYVLRPYAQNNILGELETQALTALVDGAPFHHKGASYTLGVVGVHIDSVPFPPTSASIHLLAVEDDRRGVQMPFELNVKLETLRDSATIVTRVQDGLAHRIDAGGAPAPH
jgi:hypothetical protein